MDAVARQARRQGEVKAGMDARLDHPVGRKEGRFSFAHAHRRFQHIDTRRRNGIKKSLLRGVGVKAEHIAEGKTAPEVRTPKAALHQSGNGASTAYLRCKRSFARREEILIGCDPICNAGYTS